MHDLAFEIYFLGGHQLYEFLRLTLFLGVLPSLDTVTRRCKAGRTVITHVGFVRERFLDLPRHLRLHTPQDAPFCPFVMVAMDATGVIPRITWSGATTDVISGLAVSDDELPHGPVRAGSSYEQLQALVAKHQIASLINRYMAVPLDPRMPAYDLGFFLERPGGIGSGLLAGIPRRRCWPALGFINSLSLRMARQIS